MWWRARRWRALIHLLDELPNTSRVRVAQLEDEDLADDLVRAGLVSDEASSWVPPLREYDATAALLHQMLDVLQGANWQRSGGKGGRPKPSPRPRTAMERARERVSMDTQRSFLDYIKSMQKKGGTDG